MPRTMTLAALVAALLAPVASAQNTGTAPGQGAQNSQTQGAQNTQGQGARSTQGQQAAVNDMLFAAAAASGGLAEVSVSQLGVQKATDQKLKQFSQQMIDEHSKANQELMTLAASKRVTLPTAPDVRAAFCAQSLAGLSGEEFDRCYAKAQYIIHLDSAAMFEAQATRGTDPEMKAYAAKMLPHIKEHLAMIKPIATKYLDQEKQAQGGDHGHTEK